MFKKIGCLIFVAVLTGCGGGGTSNTSPPAFAKESIVQAPAGYTDSLSPVALNFAVAPQQSAYVEASPAEPPQQARRALLAATDTSALGSQTVNGITIDQLFAWGEKNYPTLLSSPESNQFWNGYTYRYYPANDTYIGVDQAKIDSIILYNPGVAYYYKSSAVLEIAEDLGGFYSLLFIFKIFPEKFRNYIYDYIAKNRYKWYGKKESCMIPTPELKAKFL